MPGGDALADTRIGEQHTTEAVIAKMEHMDRARGEEAEVFPKLRDAVDGGRLQVLGPLYPVAKAAAPGVPNP